MLPAALELTTIQTMNNPHKKRKILSINVQSPRQSWNLNAEVFSVFSCVTCAGLAVVFVVEFIKDPHNLVE
jgi:hypothetical protein